MEDVCVNLPLPITNQSLDADTALFRTIVDICADRCSRNHIPFQKSAWNALWDCIVQCVQCLPFQSGDLFSMRNGFIHTLCLGDKGAPVSDRWIEEKLASDAPNYILIWRAYIRKWYSPSLKSNNRWQQAIGTFRSLFKNASAPSDRVLEHLDSLCNQINWAGIPFLPPPEDLHNMTKLFPGEAIQLLSEKASMPCKNVANHKQAKPKKNLKRLRSDGKCSILRIRTVYN